MSDNLDLRTQYLISRALCSLERELDRVQGTRKEQSDLADVRRLIKSFPMWKAIEMQGCLEITNQWMQDDLS